MHYAIVAYDKPNGLAHRLAVRPDHLKHLETLGDRLVLAGPFLDSNGDMVGSFMVIEAESLEDAEATFGSDPFVINGVFDSITIKPWRLGINNTSK
ncbi:MAG: YciL protein [Devosia sp.]|uniref:YciI family protein n=1 Tax=Devosia sp. TaxID=1871048 RepID=UPI002619F8AD|nr:YciI family protein [Devosia sp.]MDB5538658.1 YciL protein [Devosia sp.]